MIGCIKQNVLYWSKHSHSTQSRKSIYKTIQLAADVFGLSEEEAELFANSAGLSFEYEEGKILEKLYQPLHQIKHVLASKHWKLKVSSDESSS